MNIIISISVLLLLLIIGFIVNRNELKSMSFVHNFVAEFFERFIHFAFTKDEKNLENYKWLLGRVDRVQTYLGAGGLALYQPLFEKYVINNYRVIAELVNQLGTSSPPRGIDLETARNLLFRYLANLEVVIDQKKKELYNPLIWFRVGVQYIISFPVSLLHWFGLIEYSKVIDIRNNFIVKIISSIVATVIAIIGIISGSLNIYNNWGLISNWFLSLQHIFSQ